MTDEFEMLVIEQVLDVRAAAGKEVVKANDVGAVGEETFAQMRTEKSGTARDKDALLKMHFPIQFN